MHLPDYVKDHIQFSYGTEPAPSKDKDGAVANYAKNAIVFNVGHTNLIL